MKRSFFFIITVLFTLSAIGQTPLYEATMELFQKNYNSNDGQATFDMMAPVMQQSVSLKTITAVIQNYNENFGSMESYEFKKRQFITEFYEAQFERGKQNILISADSEGKLTGLLFKPVEDNTPAKFDRNMTKLQLPFKGEWFTYWGGDTKRQNYHVLYKPQQGAFDFLVLDENNKSYRRSGTRNEDYYAFGKPIYAVCDAIVYKVGTGVEDNRPTIMNPSQAFGNYVVLKTENEEYIFYAHFEYDTIKVAEGDMVKQGQYLGNCGNSGNSSEPHLHLHIQDGPNALNDNGAKCYFDSVMVNGELKSDYSPVKGDRVSMPKE